MIELRFLRVPALVLAGATTLAGTACTMAAATSAPQCTTDQLRARVLPLAATAGHRYHAIVVQNRSEQPCAVQGVPTVETLDANGSPVGAPATADLTWTNPDRAVTLMPGGRAHAIAFLAVAGLHDPEACGTVEEFTSVRITLTGVPGALTVPFTEQRCSRDVQSFTVTALIPGGEPTEP